MLLSLEPRRVVQRPVKVLFVFLHSPRPVEVASHAVLHQPPVLVGVLEEGLQRNPQNLLHLVWRQRENVVPIGHLVEVGGARVLDAVLEATRCVHHWDCAIGQCHHLWDPARLVAGGHEQEVATGHHFALNLWIETHVATDTAFEAGFQVSEPAAKLSFAVAHEDHLGPACDAVAFVFQEPVYDALLEDVNPLLPREATDEA
mmetsp:Transcript_21182/g.49242  ORF Transcript_21182/g.49242 Transcript_21182/m.49242 type:complete len:202 (+) Transcript_21182:88-693(+)